MRDTLVTPSVNTYPYKSYLETLLGFGRDSKEEGKSREGWYADVTGAWDDTDPTGNTTNTGLKARAGLIEQSAVLELMGRPHVDLLQQDRYLLPGVDLNFKFIRSSPLFHLMSDAAYKTTILGATLFVRKVKVTPAIRNDHAKELSDGKYAKYPLRRGIVTSFTVAQGSRSFNRENIISGQLPRRVVLGMVENAAFNGARDKNPFNFKAFGLNFLSISTGSQNFPAQPLKPDFTNNEYLQAYNSLLAGMGINNSDKGIGISRSNYVHGHVLYAFDLTADMAEGAHIDPIRNGNLRMEAGFSAALPAAMNVVVYAEYDNMIQIDRARNISTDFQ